MTTMTPGRLVELLEKHVARSALEIEIQLLEAPPGRSPSKPLVEESNWYNQLSEEDKKYVKRVIAGGVFGAVFGFLCVLDGARQVGDDPSARLVLTYSDSHGTLVLEKEGLHELFTFDWFPEGGPR